jgi:hypothetical protein
MNYELSDNELAAVCGGDRHEVSKEQYETLLAVRKATNDGNGGTAPLDLTAWKAAVAAMK